MGKFIDLTGQRFGRLVVQNLQRDDRGSVRWRCLCDCGGEKTIKTNGLTRGTLSCGCLQREKARNRLLIHGDCTRGNKKNRLFGIWAGIKNRIYNRNNRAYPNYGGRGIKLCKEWLSYPPFKIWALSHGYNDNLSIDRIDFNGDYCPENCRWVNAETQANNTRKNLYFECAGKMVTLSQLARSVNISYSVLWKRIRLRGWSIEKAISTPVKKIWG